MLYKEELVACVTCAWKCARKTQEKGLFVAWEARCAGCSAVLQSCQPCTSLSCPREQVAIQRTGTAWETSVVALPCSWLGHSEEVQYQTRWERIAGTGSWREGFTQSIWTGKERRGWGQQQWGAAWLSAEEIWVIVLSFVGLESPKVSKCSCLHLQAGGDLRFSCLCGLCNKWI